MLVWKGKSLIDGAPIVVLSVDDSTNRKTGGLVQLYILRDGVKPLDAIKAGQDVSICGQCPHRPALGGSCYVNVGHGPSATYRRYLNGNHEAFDIEAFRGRKVRLGAYGDPAAVPTHVWDAICNVADSWTGYTHQWRQADPRLARYCMASADSEADRVEAKAAGWRTFRVRVPGAPKLEREAVCPASEEAGKKLQCADCMACGGNTGRRGDIVITVHGLSHKVVKFTERVAA